MYVSSHGIILAFVSNCPKYIMWVTGLGHPCRKNWGARRYRRWNLHSGRRSASNDMEGWAALSTSTGLKFELHLITLLGISTNHEMHPHAAIVSWDPSVNPSSTAGIDAYGDFSTCTLDPTQFKSELSCRLCRKQPWSCISVIMITNGHLDKRKTKPD